MSRYILHIKIKPRGYIHRNYINNKYWNWSSSKRKSPKQKTKTNQIWMVLQMNFIST